MIQCKISLQIENLVIFRLKIYCDLTQALTHLSTELIALDSNDDDIFYLISLRRNHKDHVPRIREYYEEVIPRYTDLQLDLHLDLQFDIIFVCPGLQYSNYVYCWVIGLRFRVYSAVLPVDRQLESPLSEKVSFCVLRSLK